MGLEVSFQGLTLHVEDVERSRLFYESIPGVVLQHHRPGQFALFQVGFARDSDNFVTFVRKWIPGHLFAYLVFNLCLLGFEVREHNVGGELLCTVC